MLEKVVEAAEGLGLMGTMGQSRFYSLQVGVTFHLAVFCAIECQYRALYFAEVFAYVQVQKIT